MLWQIFHSGPLPQLWILHHAAQRVMAATNTLKKCSDVQVEPSLHPLSGKHLSLRSSKRNDGAHLDVTATNVWSHDRQHTSFDVMQGI